MAPFHIICVLRELREAGAMAFSRGSLRALNTVKHVQIAGFDENYLHLRRGLRMDELPRQ